MHQPIEDLRRRRLTVEPLGITRIASREEQLQRLLYPAQRLAQPPPTARQQARLGRITRRRRERRAGVRKVHRPRLRHPPAIRLWHHHTRLRQNSHQTP